MFLTSHDVNATGFATLMIELKEKLSAPIDSATISSGNRAGCQAVCFVCSLKNDNWHRAPFVEVYEAQFVARQLNLLGAEVTVIIKAVPPGRDLAIALRRG